MKKSIFLFLTAIIFAGLAMPTPAFCKKKKDRTSKNANRQAERLPPSPNAAILPFPSQTPGRLTTTSGKTFEAVTVTRVDPDGLLIVHKEGAAKVMFTELSRELQAQYGYEEAKARAFQAEQAASKQAEDAATDARQVEEQERQKRSKETVKIQGRVIQVVKEGMVLRVEPWEGRTPGRPPLLIGGSDYIFVAGHAKQAAKVDGDMIDVDAFPNGVFSYVNPLGEARRLRKFQVAKAFR